MERYLEAAKTILDQAIITPAIKNRYTKDDWIAKSDDSKQSIQTSITVYLDSEYLVSVEVMPVEAETQLVLHVDGIKADKFTIPGAAKNGQSPVQLKSTVRLSRGVHNLNLQSPAKLEINQVLIEEQRAGPNEASLARHRHLMTLSPGEEPDNPESKARYILTEFAARAFRRPVVSEDIQPFFKLYQRAIQRGDPFEESIKLALQGVLISPAFLFRIEEAPESQLIEPISDYELASRLSYFLWSSMPDKELFKLANSGFLQKDDVLLQQIERMLSDPRANAFARDFVGQWLGTREVGRRVAPDTGKFRDQFTTELLLDLREEPVQFFQYLVANNRSILELLDSNYAIVNRRLLEHYGYVTPKKQVDTDRNPWSKNPQRGTGGAFEKFDLPDKRRGGLLGMGAVHMLTSYPNRTSPVLRGGWVLETLLGVHVPSPPLNVPELKPAKKSKKSVREQLVEHRDNSSCSACHNLMDPVGFALDHFDVLGRWRDKENNIKIDASATLPSGESFHGPQGLRKVLLDRKDEFARHLTRKLLGYALGRSLSDRDDYTVDQIVERIRQQDYQTRALIREVALSIPFRNRQQEPAPTRLNLQE